jgi:hypothetical protein
MIETVKIQGNGYLVNGSMSVPMADGNRDYKEVLEAIEGGTENYPTAIVVEPEFTDAELLQQIEDAKPKVVTMRQARLALLQSGLLAIVESAITDGTDEAMKIEWEYATEVKRDWSSLIALTETLGMTSQELDDLFQLASTL